MQAVLFIFCGKNEGLELVTRAEGTLSLRKRKRISADAAAQQQASTSSSLVSSTMKKP